VLARQVVQPVEGMRQMPPITVLANRLQERRRESPLVDDWGHHLVVEVLVLSLVGLDGLFCAAESIHPFPSPGVPDDRLEHLVQTRIGEWQSKLRRNADGSICCGHGDLLPAQPSVGRLVSCVTAPKGRAGLKPGGPIDAYLG
jgi:hypothetical protein